ncbi:MAG: fibronectin type III domain-containing protein [Thermoplasmata archaeon]|nr:fibronectin type III domain-containing protein [Thermoplasmata archaeon]
MRLLKGTTLGAIATVLVLAMTLLSFLGSSALAAPGTTHSAVVAPRGASHLSLSSHTSPAAHPLAGTVPNPPTGLTVGVVTFNSVALNWTNPGGGGLLNNTIHVGYACGAWMWNISTGAPALTHTVINLRSLQAYCFAVTVWNVTGESNASNTATAKTHIIPGSPLVTVAFITALPLYFNLPTNLAWKVTVVNQTVHANNTWVFLTVATGATMLNNISLAPELVAGNQSTFNVTLTTDTFKGAPGSQMLFTAWAYVNNSANNSNGQTWGWGSNAQTGYAVVNVPTATVISPSPGFVVGPGNQTVVVQYSGDFVNGASVNITQGSTVVYTESVFAVGGGTQTVAAPSPWTVTASGVYKITVTLTRPFFGATSWSWNVTANVPTASQGFIYINTTKYVNSTVTNSGGNGGNIDGVAPGVLAAALLVAGLLVGMVVALFLGRMLWGGSKPAAPQAWSAKPTTECSICHQTFATEDELKEHSKTAHGM